MNIIDSAKKGAAESSAYGYINAVETVDATQGWYSDYAGFVGTSSPWFLRGDNYNGSTIAGVFSFFF